jgi:hypothetical protein
MPTLRPLALLLIASLLAGGAAHAQDGRKERAGSSKAKPSAGKLYRWTDAQGKVHYTDTLPPEALEQGRTEYSRKGSLLNQVQRAPTAEEKALREQELQQARADAEEEKIKARDQLAFQAAYPSEEAIARDFQQRKQTLEGQIKTQQVLMAEQRKSLLSQLEMASTAELMGKTVSPKMAANIQSMARQVRQYQVTIRSLQEQILALEQQEKDVRAQWISLQSTATPITP